MGKLPDRVDRAIWCAASASNFVFADAVPEILKLLSNWATEVLGKPVRVEPYGSVVTGITDTSSDIDVALSLPDSTQVDAGDTLAKLHEGKEKLPAFQASCKSTAVGCFCYVFVVFSLFGNAKTF